MQNMKMKKKKINNNIYRSVNCDHHCMSYVETPAFHKITLVCIVPASWALTSTEDTPLLQKCVDKKLKLKLACASQFLVKLCLVLVSIMILSFLPAIAR